MRLLPLLTPPQRDRAELLDQKCGSSHEVEKSLRDIARINKYLGGARVVQNALWPLLEGKAEATILDIGTGSADIPRALVQLGRKRGIKLTVFAADLLERHLQIARRDCAGFPSILPLGADAFSLPLRDKSVDVVTASLFLHHFRPPQIVALLREFERVSRLGFIANDLVRDLVPLAFFRLSAPIFARSYLTRYDGAASILRAYTAQEIREIVESSGVATTVSEHFPYRLSVVGSLKTGIKYPSWTGGINARRRISSSCANSFAAKVAAAPDFRQNVEATVSVSPQREVNIMVRIRLRRTGAKNNPAYRIVVADQKSPRDGAFIDTLGHYLPTRQPHVVEIDADKARKWLSQGAQPSDTAMSLLRQKGIVDEQGKIVQATTEVAEAVTA